MVYTTINDKNVSEGLHVLFQYSNEVTNGYFVGFLLLMIFMVVLMGTYYSSRRTGGIPSFPSSFAVAGYITFGVTILLSFIENMMTIPVFSISLAISILGTIWLFFSNSD